ncbi:YfhO family protein [Allostreptomyces psammosilenae]|uniref:Putative membrane protein YfhO n=1 Tax=Allostreptomyces psammosilenae TaxID=1892865 RepID=A0A852ZVN4_9ACTN|nr:YfhO family protein [Allostreptomyces psammosilenae]NYI06005.1 putative membrane protein YfhO [Allostreptomyces psammosilenae]
MPTATGRGRPTPAGAEPPAQDDHPEAARTPPPRDGTGTTRRRLPAHGGRTAAAAGALATLAFCLSQIAGSIFPFGPASRNVNDLANQYVPYHAHLRDLLLGRGDGDWLFNWQSGYGSSFLPDVGTYLSSPINLLVVLFPHDRIDLAVHTIIVVKIALAAAVMALLLLRIAPGGPDRRAPWPVAAVLGAAYALCGWTLSAGSYNPMWLDGLIGLPLLFLVAEWAREGRHAVLSPVVVGYVWFTNFYTGYMTTVGAAVYLLIRLSAGAAGPREWGATLLRAVRAVAIGIAMAAPLVAVIYLATRTASPIPPAEFAPSSWNDVLARLLPATYSFSAPALFVGTGTLLVALSLPFHRQVAPRTRLVWSLALVGVAVSFQWTPTHLLWHAFTSPNGSSYRQAFVLSALLVVAAWLALAHGLPDRRALLGGGVLAVLLLAGAAGSQYLSDRSVPLFVACAVATIGGIALARWARARGTTALALGVVVALAAVQCVEAAVANLEIERARVEHLDDYPTWGPWHDGIRREVLAGDGWPEYRTDTGESRITGNDPMLFGGQGANYYSSLTSETMVNTYTALGFGWTSTQRSPRSLDNPVTDAIYSVGVRVRSPEGSDNTADDVTSTRTEVPPLVTVRPGGEPPRFGANAFENQELLLGSDVYEVPTTTVTARQDSTVTEHDDGHTTIDPAEDTDGPTHLLQARCAPGTDVYLWAPDYRGVAALAGTEGSMIRSRMPSQGAGMRHLGTVPDSGEVTVELDAERPAALPAGPVGCLDDAALDQAVQDLTETGATDIEVGGHSISAELPAGTTGWAVIAAPRISGWSCASGDGTPRPADDYLGLLAVPLEDGDTTVSCSFRPPGMRLGGAVGTAGLAGLVLIGILDRRRRRTADTPPPPAVPRQAP